MKKYFIIICCLLATTCLWAYDYQIGNLGYYLDSENKTATVTQGSSKPTGKLDIPTSVTLGGITYTVTKIK